MPRVFAATGIPAIRSRALFSSLFLFMALAVAAGGSGSAQSSATPTATAIPTIALAASLAQKTGYVASTGATVSSTGTVYALNAQNGKAGGTYATGGMYGTPVLADGAIYIAPQSDEVIALDAASGVKRWSFTRPDGDRDSGYHGYVAVAGSTVYAAAGSVYAGANDYNLYALDAKTGVVRWRFLTGDVVWSRPAVANGLVYVAPRDQYVYALHTADGKLLWKVKTTGTAAEPPLPTGAATTLVGDALYVGAQGEAVYAIKAADGAQIWRHDVGVAVDNAPTVVDGAVFVTTQRGSVYALRASDGAVGLTYKTDGLTEGSPVVEPLGRATFRLSRLQFAWRRATLEEIGGASCEGRYGGRRRERRKRD
jgi:outer membrane protein assembly factor BamB